MAGQQRSHYPEFAQALYRLAQIMANSRAPLIERANFTTTDTAAFDTLTDALNVGTAYFPPYVEQG